jgi:hypothetical protein
MDTARACGTIATALLMIAAQARVGGQSRQPDPLDFDDHVGWQSLFDGTTLAGWDGNSSVWRVADGAIVGEYTTEAGARNGSTFLVWQGGEPADFELKLEIRLEGEGADSGIQYRASRPPAPATGTPNPNARWNIIGYQFDFNAPGNYNGQIAEAGAGARGVIAYRGQVVQADPDRRPRIISEVGTLEALGEHFQNGEWNQVHLIARGNTLTQMINGRVMAILIDEDPAKFKSRGLIGLQCAGTGPVRIAFRNVWLKPVIRASSRYSPSRSGPPPTAG